MKFTFLIASENSLMCLNYGIWVAPNLTGMIWKSHFHSYARFCIQPSHLNSTPIHRNAAQAQEISEKLEISRIGAKSYGVFHAPFLSFRSAFSSSFPVFSRRNLKKLRLRGRKKAPNLKLNWTYTWQISETKPISKKTETFRVNCEIFLRTRENCISLYELKIRVLCPIVISVRLGWFLDYSLTTRFMVSSWWPWWQVTCSF